MVIIFLNKLPELYLMFSPIVDLLPIVPIFFFITCFSLASFGWVSMI
nr:Photosystem II reaction center protein K [Syringoderma abyssicola]WAM65038.1 Photosystem II reaction center protein K [Syringoderma abyssicola]